MEAGNRPRVREVFDGTAVDLDVAPSSPFQLVDVTLSWDSAATTPEAITITSINEDGDEIEEDSHVPAALAVSVVRRFDKRFPRGTSLNIAYANTDENEITVNAVYQIDQSVV